MSIDIKGMPPGRPQNAVNKPAEQAANVQKQAAQQSASRPAPAQQDAVSLTSTAQQLSQTSQTAGRQPPAVDQQRVQALKKAIAEGQYRVNPEKLAKAMASLEGALFGDAPTESV